MEHFALELREVYPFLGEEGRVPRLEAFLRPNFSEKNQKDPNRPAILILHGGGYSSCTKREADPIALAFLAEGFHTFVLYYSLAPHHDPAQITEVAAAMDLIRENAEKWHVDAEKIALMGFSAGGHLAAYYSNRYDCEAVRKHFPESRRPNACVLSYALLTADASYTHTCTLERLVGHENASQEELQAFSCEKMVTPGTPPTFLWMTRTDETLPVMNALLYAEALTKNDVPFSMHIYPTGKHALATADDRTNHPDNLANGASFAGSWIFEASRWIKLTFEIGA